MKHLFRIVLSAAVVATMTLACKKEQPEPKKDTTFVLEATVTGEAKYDGSGDLSYSVKSIKKVGEKEEFMPWTMEFSTDGGNTWKAEKPDYLTLTTKEENGDLTAKTYTAKFTAQEKTIGGTSADILKAREILNDVDLAHRDIHGNTHSNGQTTANCYVIHNPGTYKFPTVYGNSRKNGQDNTSAYTSTKNGANILKNFIKADGNAIDKPQIDNIDNACLIWQDTKDLISNISFDSANQYVKFEVNKATIHNGNAIIAVRDNSNTILWSWHIWVTEEDLTPVEITNHGGYKYNILPVNLGWCGLGNATEYAQREVKIRIKQQSGNKTADLAFNQKGHFIERDKKIGNCTFYQWGRKDPMLPGNGITAGDGKDKTCYTTDAQYAFQARGLNTADIKEYIRNPHKFNINGDMDGKYYNLWSTDNERTDANDDKVIKTVYDPSPVGYTLPAPNAFTGFTTTGKEASNPTEYNVNGGFNKGWNFYTKPNKQGSIVFFPATGRRDNSSGSVVSVATNGSYWVAGPVSPDYGRDLYFNSGRVSPLYYSSRSYGFTVRPAQEQ
ncbi:MAG: fimbrillin family protein [Candidatus Cryptobacteroides sp.]